MASNSTLIMKGDSRLLGGFSNMFSKENHRWWRTRQWLVQTFVWMAFINGILAMMLWSEPTFPPGMDEAARQAIIEQIPNQSLEVFFIMLGSAGAVGVTLLGQDAMLNEKNRGTAAWVLSKPASRGAFVLSKVISYSLGILVTMVIIQGSVGYLLIRIATGKVFPLPEFAGAMGLTFLGLVFYFTLTIMLGSISNSRGVVIGIPILLNLGYQLFLVIGDWVAEIMPWNLYTSVGTAPAMPMLLIDGQPFPTLIPLVATPLWIILFIAVALWRFSREEF